MQYILSYDLGTGGLKASLFDEGGSSIAHAFASCDTYYPREQFHEQRPEDWWHMLVESTGQLLAKAQVDPQGIRCLAVSGHSLGVVPVDGMGRLLTEYTPIWSDSRAGEEAADFFRTVPEEEWYLTTGNGFPAGLYSIFKIMWMKRHLSDVYQKAACFLGTKDYLNLRLTGVMATDHSYASGSGVYDLQNRRYLPEWIHAAGVAADKLPTIYESTHILGALTQEAAQQLGLPQTVLVAAGGVDNACMALGAACTQDGDAYTSLGSSAWVAVASRQPVVSVKNRPYVFAHCIPHMYVSATSIFSAGNSFRWLKNTFFTELEQKAKAEGKDSYDVLTDMAAQSPVGSNRLIFNPNMAGGSGLDKSNHVKGCYTGLTLGHTVHDVIRATLEGISMNLRLAMDVLADCVQLSPEMLLVGGGGKSRFWRSIFANVYRKDILETNVGQDAGALGAAALAAVGAGLWPSFDMLKQIHQMQETIHPDPAAADQYEALLPVFRAINDMQSDVGDMLHSLTL